MHSKQTLTKQDFVGFKISIIHNNNACDLSFVYHWHNAENIKSEAITQRSI